MVGVSATGSIMRRPLAATMILALLIEPAAATMAGEEPGTAGTFTPAGSLNETGGLNAAALLPDGRVFVFGGGPGPSAAEIWDPATDTFTAAAWLTWGRTFSTATTLPDGRVLVVGGQPDTVGAAYPRSWDVLRVAETWDLVTHRFSPAGILNRSRAAHTSILLPDGRILVIGGELDEYSGTTAELWDHSTGTFELVEWLAVSRFAPSETLLSDGRVLIVGGGNPFDLGPDPVEAVVWDPETGAFSSSGSLTEARLNHTSTLLSDGRVLVAGGFGEDGPLASAEVWEPSTGVFSPTGSLREPRALHTGTLLPDGRVLIVGGWHDESGTYIESDSAEIWSPTTGEFTAAGSLVEARDNHTATLLPDGRVLVVGGSGQDGPLSSAEVWTPTDQDSDLWIQNS